MCDPDETLTPEDLELVVPIMESPGLWDATSEYALNRIREGIDPREAWRALIPHVADRLREDDDDAE